MTLDHDRSLTDYFKNEKRKDGKSHTIKISPQAPEDSVHLAYAQGPDVNIKESMNMTDETFVSENVLSQEDKESLAIANEEGKLEYINYYGGNKFNRRDPGTNIPTDNVIITKKFYRDDMKYRNALFYRLEINYHYDTMLISEEEEISSEPIEYRGNQIEIVNANGDKIYNNSEIVYQLFVQPQRINKRVFKIILFINKTTTEKETIKIRYNHIDADIGDNLISYTSEEIELYGGEHNQINVSGTHGDELHYLLGSGKIRVVNGDSYHKKTALSEVDEESQKEGKKKPIYYIEENEDGNSFTITVPEKTIEDNREFKKINYRIMAEYEDLKGDTYRYSSGLIVDVLMNEASILPFEERDYLGKFKRLGIPKDEGFINSVKEVLDLSLPNGISGIPEDSRIWIEDTKGDILYNIQVFKDDPYTETKIQMDYAYGYNKTVDHSPLIDEDDDVQYIYESKPISSKFSIIPETQEKEWDFEFEVNGEGYTEELIKISGTWKIGAVIREKRKYQTNRLDVTNKKLWASVGINKSAKDKNPNECWEGDDAYEKCREKYDPIKRWGTTRDPITKRLYLTFYDNTEDVIGFYQKYRYKSDTDHTLVPTADDRDYEFSTRVRMNDLVDDDAVGIIFRLKSPQEYYLFVWEKHETQTERKKYIDYHPNEVSREDDLGKVFHGTGRPNFTKHGYQAIQYLPDEDKILNELRYNDKDKFLTEAGFGLNHKRIFKVTPSIFKKKAVHERDFMENPNQRYPRDITGSSFEDITELESPNYSSKGWVPQKDYKITVVTRGSRFEIYINEEAESKERGKLVCEGSDETYPTGSYGIATISQRWTYWDRLTIEESEDITIYSDEFPHTFERKGLEFVSGKSPIIIMKDKIEEFMNAPENQDKDLVVDKYIGASTSTTITYLDDKYILGKPHESEEERIEKTPWLTGEHGSTVSGKGTVTYHEDGYLDVEYDPREIPQNVIPEEVKGFKWNDPVITSGHSVDIELVKNKYVNVTPHIPPIRQIGRIYHSPDHLISKEDYVKEIEKIFIDASGLKNKFNIKDHKLKDVMLRIEKGHVQRVEDGGYTITKDANHLVNYRFRTEKEGEFKYPVDQHIDETGVNRLRISNLLDLSEEEIDGFKTSIVAWTNYPNLRAYPVFGIKIDEDRYIDIEHPRVESETEEFQSWYPRVKDGRIQRRVRLPKDISHKLYSRNSKLRSYAGKEIDVIYKIKERTREIDSPFVYISKEQPKIISPKEIKVKHKNLVLSNSKGVPSVEVYVDRGTGKKRIPVSDVDSSKGVIELTESMKESDKVFVDYIYKEEYATYKGFDKFNIDFNPTQGHNYSIGKDNNSIEEIIPLLDEVGKYSIIRRESSELIHRTTYLYMVPYEYRTIKGKRISNSDKDYTIAHTFNHKLFIDGTLEYDPTLLLLSKINLGFNYDPEEDTILVDIRQRGGGIKERVRRRDIKEIGRDSLSNWDIGYWDGEAYQENGVVLIRINDKVFKNHSKEEIDARAHAIVNKYKAYGVYPIIEYYSEEDKFERMIINNYNFENGRVPTYYHQEQSSGIYEIQNIPSTNDYMLAIKGKSKYTLRIPGYQFNTGEYYNFEVRAKRATGSDNQMAYSIYVLYTDGKFKRIEGNKITNTRDWQLIYSEVLMKKEVLYVDFVLGNELSNSNKGDYFYREVIVRPLGKN